jgi:hypothetical protein
MRRWPLNTSSMKSDLQYYFEKRYSGISFSSLTKHQKEAVEGSLGFTIWQVMQELKKLCRYIKFIIHQSFKAKWKK